MLRVDHVVAVRLPVVSPQLHLRPVLNARMSAIPTDEPAQEAPPSLDAQQIQQQLQQQDSQSVSAEPNRKRESSIQLFNSLSISTAKAPSVRRACVACHTGKTRCSEVLPCQVGSALLLLLCSFGSLSIQSCLKRGLGATCAYPDPDAQEHHGHQTPGIFYFSPPLQCLSHCLSSHSSHQCSIRTSTNVCNTTSA